jgi:hypothetical protein
MIPPVEMKATVVKGFGRGSKVSMVRVRVRIKVRVRVRSRIRVRVRVRSRIRVRVRVRSRIRVRVRVRVKGKGYITSTLTLTLALTPGFRYSNSKYEHETGYFFLLFFPFTVCLFLSFCCLSVSVFFCLVC